jgi:hypothetical protein
MNLMLLAVVLAAPPQAPRPPQAPPLDEARVRQIAREEVKSYLEAQPRAAQPAPAAAPKAWPPLPSDEPHDPDAVWQFTPHVGWGWVSPRAAQPAPAAALPPAPECVNGVCAVPGAAVNTGDQRYEDALYAVESGQRVTLFVGVPVMAYSTLRVQVFGIPADPRVPNGVYDCERVNGVARFTRRPDAPATYAAPTPVRSFFAPRYSTCPGGNCPR